MKFEVSVFELPKLLGIPQYVEFEPPPKEWCTPDSCRSVERCVEEILNVYEHAKNAQPRPRRDPAEEEYEELLQRYPLLRWWRRDVVIDALKRGEAYRWGLRNLLNRLSNVDEKVWVFLSRFGLDFRCSVDVYASSDGELCVRFHVDNCDPRLYCHKQGEGWRPVSDTPKFLRYRPTEDGRLVEVYTIENKEYMRVA